MALGILPHSLSSYYPLLSKIGYLLVLANFIVLIYMFYLNRNVFSGFFKQISKRTMLLLIIIMLIALVFHVFVFKPQHYIYIDEQLYMDRAVKMLHWYDNNPDYTKIPGTGISEEWYYKSPGWPFILSMVFGVFGINNFFAIYAGIFFSIGTVFLVYCILRLLLDDGLSSKVSELFSVSGAFVYALIPLNILFGSTADNIVPSLFFVALSLFAIFMYFKLRTSHMLYLVIALLAFTSQFRLENYIFAGFFFLLFYVDEFKSWLKNGRPINFIPVLAYVLFTCVDLFFLFQFSNVTECSFMALHTFGMFLAELTGMPVILLLFVIVIVMMVSGIAYLISRRRYAYLVMILSLFFCTFSVLLFFWINGIFGFFPFVITYFSLFNRFVVIGMFTATLLSLPGIFFIMKLLLKAKKLSSCKYCKQFVYLAVMCIFVFIAGLFVLNIFSNKEAVNDDNSILEAKLPNLISNDLPEESIIISACPEIFVTTKFRNTFSFELLSANLLAKNYILNNTVSHLNKTFVLVDNCCRVGKNTCNPEDFNLSLYKSYYYGKAVFNLYMINVS